MTTVILGLGALTIVLGYRIKKAQEKYNTLFEKFRMLDCKFWENNRNHQKGVDVLKEKHAAEKESWKQTSSAWVLEKEKEINDLGVELHEAEMKYKSLEYDSDVMVKKIKQEKFDQLHELALMLNDSYKVDEVILKKAELHDYLLHNSNRKQRREFIEKGYIEL